MPNHRGKKSSPVGTPFRYGSRNDDPGAGILTFYGAEGNKAAQIVWGLILDGLAMLFSVVSVGLVWDQTSAFSAEMQILFKASALSMNFFVWCMLLKRSAFGTYVYSLFYGADTIAWKTGILLSMIGFAAQHVMAFLGGLILHSQGVNISDLVDVSAPNAGQPIVFGLISGFFVTLIWEHGFYSNDNEDEDSSYGNQMTRRFYAAFTTSIAIFVVVIVFARYNLSVVDPALMLGLAVTHWLKNTGGLSVYTGYFFAAWGFSIIGSILAGALSALFYYLQGMAAGKSMYSQV